MALSARPAIVVSDGAISSTSGSRRSFALNLLISLRPTQWTKNLIVFAALIFGRALFDPSAAILAAATFVAFCGLSGVVYLVNDLADREQDRQHPINNARPISSGALAARTVWTAAGMIGSASLAGMFWISSRLGVVGLGYLALQILYSFVLKRVAIVDVLTIAIGFVLRAVAGGVAIHVPISEWLIVCTILLALFLALSKRRYELTLLANEAICYRPALRHYSPYLLDQMIGVVTAATLMSYVLYTTDADTVARFGTRWVVLTIPLAIYGIFRYLYLLHRTSGGTPSDLLLTDRPLIGCVIVWALTVVFTLYW